MGQLTPWDLPSWGVHGKLQTCSKPMSQPPMGIPFPMLDLLNSHGRPMGSLPHRSFPHGESKGTPKPMSHPPMRIPFPMWDLLNSHGRPMGSAIPIGNHQFTMGKRGSPIGSHSWDPMATMGFLDWVGPFD